MTHKAASGRKGKIYATIIGLVLAANIALTAAIVFINYPTESHRSVARQLDVLNTSMWTGSDWTTVMETDEYKELMASPESKYSDAAAIYTLIFNALASVAIIGGVYYYLRKHRVTNKPVGATVLLVTFGQLVSLVFAQFATAAYLGTQMPGVGSIAFMLFVGLVIAPLVIMLIVRIIDWHYNRKHSFVIE